MSTRWSVRSANEKIQERLASKLNILPLTAQLLINRGLVDIDKASLFLSPDINNLHDPMLLKDMDKAVARLALALENKESVAVCGDYDVDGTTATALLKLFLAEIGFPAIFTHIPERITEGYGLNNNALKELSEKGVKVVITTDCGISNYQETVFANSLGMDVIITDHHEIPLRIPPAYAILNPRQEGCPFPFKGLAGVGVAFNLVMALRGHLRDTGHISKATQPNLKKYLDLVAIGTVADMVPLKDENRIFVKHGLDQLKRSERVGLRALIDICLTRDKRLTTDKISYQIAPRINAAGRVSRAAIALDLLTTDDPERARALAVELDTINTERRLLEKEITDEALDMIDPKSEDKGIFLYSRNWHPGVIGIVASKISNRFNKPTLMISIDNEGIGRGSARGAIANFDLLAAIKSCERFLEKYGGHKAAAGLTIKSENIEGFKSEFIALLNRSIAPDDLIPRIDIDAVISLDEVNLHLVSEIERLSPFGISNREPLLGALDANIVDTRVVGSKHLQLQVRHKGKPLKAIGFGLADIHPVKGHGFDIAFTPFVDLWGGRKKLSLKVKDLKSSEIKGVDKTMGRS